MPGVVRAQEGSERYYIGVAVNAGEDTGYSKTKTIKEDDPHFGWSIGNFYVDGYTRVISEDPDNPTFLKTVGDTVTLWFQLDQDIKKLNGNSDLSICKDEDGYDEYFGIKKTNFGRGTLIIRHTDYTNQATDPVIYTDYLAANATTGAAVQVELFEEGDYEVALNYEIREENVDIFGWNPFSSYYDYRIFFRFSVRNGNCMVYPFDALTGAELSNSSCTENGFYLDLANSRYLNIDIKREVRKEGVNGLTEDVRFNKPASDGEKYTDEGIYTITVSNLYTNQTTTKVIYVGTDEVLKAHATTGLPIDQIEYQLSLGATVSEDGMIIPVANTEPPTEVTEPSETTQTTGETTASSESGDETALPQDATEDNWLIHAALAAILLVGAIGVIVVVKRKKTKTSAKAAKSAAVLQKNTATEQRTASDSEETEEESEQEVTL